MPETSTVLIIDDEEDLRQSVADALESRGYEVLLACNGSEGIEQARERVPNLILVDYRMPEVDGVAFLNQLRGNENLREIPVVVITVDPELELRRSASELGIQGFLVKPFSMEELVQTVRNLTQTN